MEHITIASPADSYPDELLFAREIPGISVDNIFEGSFSVLSEARKKPRLCTCSNVFTALQS